MALWGTSHVVYRLTDPVTPRIPRLIAHRGGAALAPENTLPAFRNALNLKVDMLETDVRQSRDGVLVLMHDSSVSRTTPGTGSVERLSWEQLDSLGVTTFEQFLALARPGQAQILPEVKGGNAGIEEAIVRSLSDAGMIERTYVQSFSPTSLKRIHQLSPQLRLCRIYYPWGLLVGENPEGVTVVSPMAEALLVNPWMVRQAHARGWQVWPWFAGLESKLTIHWILSLGVDGLMVDDPRLWPTP